MTLDAMILAAGLGTRLGELGRDTPKALIEVGGTTMLERALRAVTGAGAGRVVVNVHHWADRIAAFLAARDWGAEVLVSHEEERPLETGGGLLHARERFRRDATILVHNVDVATDADLAALVTEHGRSRALATLAVSARQSTRLLLFDDDGLCGREDRRRGLEIDGSRPPHGELRRWAFSGIHVCAPQLFDLVTERGSFPIVDVYLRLARDGQRILPWPHVGSWFEIGSLERLEAARAALGR